MIPYILQRFVLMFVTLFFVTLVTFAVIELPPGDFLDTYVSSLRASGDSLDDAEIASLRQRFGLGLPIHERYFKWISNIVLRGDFGYSFGWNKPVSELIWERVGITVAISLVALLITLVL